MIIRSLLDTDLYKFTMMQVVLHHFPGAQVEYRFRCRNPAVDLTPYVDEIRDEIRALYPPALHRRRARLPARLALLQERFRRSARALPARRALHHRRTPAGRRRRNRHHDQGTMAAHDPVRGAAARHRQRSLFPQCLPESGPGRGTAAARGEDRADQRGSRSRVPHRGLRHAASLLARVAGRGRADAAEGHRPEIRRHEQRAAGDAAWA